MTSIPRANALQQSAQKPLLIFFVFTLLFSWLIWFIPVFIPIEDGVVFRHLNAIGAFGPAMAGVMITYLLHGKELLEPAHVRIEQFSLALIGVAALYFICLPFASSTPMLVSPMGWILRILLFITAASVVSAGMKNHPIFRGLLLPVGKHTGIAWYPVAILAFPVLLVSGLALSAISGNTFTIQAPENGAMGLSVQILTTFVYSAMFGGALAEESGWRGFVLPRLLERMAPLWSSLLLGLAIAVWQLPLFFNGTYPASDFNGAAMHLTWTVLLTFVYTWFYLKSRRNVFITLLLHAGYAASVAFIATTLLTLVVMAVVVVILVIESRLWQKA